MASLTAPVRLRNSAADDSVFIITRCPDSSASETWSGLSPIRRKAFLMGTAAAPRYRAKVTSTRTSQPGALKHCSHLRQLRSGLRLRSAGYHPDGSAGCTRKRDRCYYLTIYNETTPASDAGA